VHDDIEGFLDYSEVRNHCNGLLLLEEDVGDPGEGEPAPSSAALHGEGVLHVR
jgi:hypothetical protein